MAGGRCEFCGVEEYMPFVCKFCKGRYCAAHRLPENHDCQGLVAFKDRAQSEGRVYVTPDSPPPKPARAARVSAPTLSSFWSRVEGKMSYIILGVCVAVFVLQIALRIGGIDDVKLLGIGPDFVQRPWTVVTSIFAHGSVQHIFFNMLVLVFFGAAVEKLIGTRRFTGLFLGAGIVAGIAQVVLEQLFFHTTDYAVGASGALMGLTGALVVLAPTLTVLVFFVIPAPLWALGIFYVLLDLVGVFDATDYTAHFAHLGGFAVGAAYGYYLRQRGLRAVVRPREPTQRTW